MASWLVIDSLYCPGQYFASHLDSFGHYLREYGEEVTRCCLNGFTEMAKSDEWQGWIEPSQVFEPNGWTADVAFFLDGYGRAMEVQTEKRIAQVAAICAPMPWEVRKPDGSPAFDLVVSSLPWMVEAARAAGCRAEYQPLSFDLRARAAAMGVKREPRVIFIGTRSPAHPGRERVLAELRDLVEVVPPLYGRAYFRALAGATVLVQPHLGWAQGCANSMKTVEAPGVGTGVVYDGLQAHGGPAFGFSCQPGNMSAWRGAIADALGSPYFRELHEGEVLVNHTYEKRIPDLVRWAKEV